MLNMDPDTLTDADIEVYIDARAHARCIGNFATADKIRDLLLDFDVVLQDRPNGQRTEWRNATRKDKNRVMAGHG